jgi:CMP-2-keto-3-deoxyoctulosonic acid synthetase
VRDAAEFGAEVGDDFLGAPSGTDRVAEVIANGRKRRRHRQGDEPLVEPGLIDRLAAALRKIPGCRWSLRPIRWAIRAGSGPNGEGRDELQGERSISLASFHRRYPGTRPFYRHHGICGYSRVSIAVRAVGLAFGTPNS